MSNVDTLANNSNVQTNLKATLKEIWDLIEYLNATEADKTLTNKLENFNGLVAHSTHGEKPSVKNICQDSTLPLALIKIIRKTNDLNLCTLSVDILLKLLSKYQSTNDKDRLTLIKSLTIPINYQQLFETLELTHTNHFATKCARIEVQLRLLKILDCLHTKRPRHQFSSITCESVKYIQSLASENKSNKEQAEILLNLLKLICRTKKFCQTLGTRQFFDDLYHMTKLTHQGETATKIMRAMSKCPEALAEMRHSENVLPLILTLVNTYPTTVIAKKSLIATLYRLCKKVPEKISSASVWNGLLECFKSHQNVEEQRLRMTIIKLYTLLNMGTKRIVIASSCLNYRPNFSQKVKQNLKYASFEDSENDNDYTDDDEEDDENDGRVHENNRHDSDISEDEISIASETSLEDLTISSSNSNEDVSLYKRCTYVTMKCFFREFPVYNNTDDDDDDRRIKFYDSLHEVEGYELYRLVGKHVKRDSYNKQIAYPDAALVEADAVDDCTIDATNNRLNLILHLLVSIHSRVVMESETKYKSYEALNTYFDDYVIIFSSQKRTHHKKASIQDHITKGWLGNWQNFIRLFSRFSRFCFDPRGVFMRQILEPNSSARLIDKVKVAKGFRENNYPSRIVYHLDELLEDNRPLNIPIPGSFDVQSAKDKILIDLQGDKAPPALSFESRFESGNLRYAKQVGDFEYDLLLAPDVCTSRGHQWFYFQITNMVCGKPYTFNIINFDKINSQFNYGMQPVLFSVRDHALNGTGWKRAGEKIVYYGNHFTNEEHTKQYRTLTFSVSFDFNDDFCYLAYHYPYTYTRLLAQLNCFSSHQKNIYSRVDNLCCTVSGNYVPLITITAAEGKDSFGIPFDKRPMVFFTGRVHPGESNSSWILDGIIKFLLNDNDEKAKAAREMYIFKIVPMLNPEGVIFGNTRNGLTGCDLNRCWLHPNKYLHPEIYYTKKLVEFAKKELKHHITTFIDVHGHSRKKYFFFYGCNPQMSWNKNDKSQSDNDHHQIIPEEVSFNENMKSSFCQYKIEKKKETTCRVVMWREFSIKGSYTLECSYCSGENKKKMTTKILQDIGQSLVVALSNLASKVLLKKSKLADLGLDYTFLENVSQSEIEYWIKTLQRDGGLQKKTKETELTKNSLCYL